MVPRNRTPNFRERERRIRTGTSRGGFGEPPPRSQNRRRFVGGKSGRQGNDDPKPPPCARQQEGSHGATIDCGAKELSFLGGSWRGSGEVFMGNWFREASFGEAEPKPGNAFRGTETDVPVGCADRRTCRSCWMPSPTTRCSQTEPHASKARLKCSSRDRHEPKCVSLQECGLQLPEQSSPEHATHTGGRPSRCLGKHCANGKPIGAGTWRLRFGAGAGEAGRHSWTSTR